MGVNSRTAITENVYTGVYSIYRTVGVYYHLTMKPSVADAGLHCTFMV